ncbi:MAG: DNA glycosylase [Dehalococcoidia bacterium]
MTHETLLPAGEIDLAATLDGGQAFRWRREGDGYRGVIGRSVLHISMEAAGRVRVRVLAGERVQPVDVERYLGLDFDLDAFRERYAADPGLAPALAACAGLRVLRQDPWECLCGFICSATNSIPQIKRNVAALAADAGERIGPSDGDFVFPDAAAVAGLGEPRLRELGLGFRARYVAAAAEAIASGAWDLAALPGIPYEMAKGALAALPGVGPKIADCVLAFSLDKGEAFPVDIWVRRAVLRRYGLSDETRDNEIGRFARARFGRDAAYANQYLFHHQRLTAQAG